ncbi:CRTAC1 family protein [Armatimonas sp.]|uniref:CRTAC1 family protein n=1 Tax=Armatimonas sp. TaxID=1872638 RepID=UPI003751765B
MAQNNAGAPKAVALLAFIGLLGWSWWRNQKNVLPPTRNVAGGPQALAASDSLPRYGFALTQSAKALGVDFTHTSPTLDPKLAPILPRIADMGAGVAVADYDKDGWPDFYVTRSGENSKNALYHNKGDGTFEEVAEKLGVADLNKDGSGTSQGALWGDFDGDGWEDLLVYKWGRAELLKNNAGKSFTRVTETANLPQWMNANTATLLDYDRDGKLDILLCGYFDEQHDLWHLKTTKIMPDALNFASNGATKHLLHNEGNFTFRDTTQEVGMTNRSWLLAAIAADLRGTGYPDLFLASDYGKPELWRNNNGKSFTQIGEEAGIRKQSKSGMNAAFGDIYNDGRLSVYISNIWEDGQLMQGNNLWVPKEGTGKSLEYENLAEAVGVEKGGWSFGAQFGDLNNDGFQDLYLTNGYISADKDKSYWYDYATITPATAEIIKDVVNWPPMKGRSLSGYQQKRVWLNDGAGRFTEVAQAVGATDLFDGRAVALADLDNNGTLDILVANQRGPLLVYKNQSDPKNHWLTVSLEGKTSPIGAEVTLFWKGMKQRQVVTGGVGFCAQNDRRLHFGLGTSSMIEKVEIRWPGGKITTVPAPKANQILTIKESTP